MKLSNFRHLKTETHIVGKTLTAEVDVTTGFLFWKKTETKKVVKNAAYWYWAENGKYTPGHQLEEMERAYRAQLKKE